MYLNTSSLSQCSSLKNEVHGFVRNALALHPTRRFMYVVGIYNVNRACGVELIPALLQAGAMKIEQRGLWANEANVDTTILLSAAEFRDIAQVTELLALGADPRAVTALGFGIFDLILMGRNGNNNISNNNNNSNNPNSSYSSYSSYMTVKKILEIIDVVMPYMGNMWLTTNVVSKFMYDPSPAWAILRKNERLSNYVRDAYARTWLTLVRD
jgi:hypothetical protein